MTLKCIKDAEFTIGKLRIVFNYGHIIRERSLEQTKVDDFNRYFAALLDQLIELKAITEENSNLLATSMDKELRKTKKIIDQMDKTAKKERESIQPLLDTFDVYNSKVKTAIDPSIKEDFTNLREEALNLIEEARKTHVKNSSLEDVVQDLYTFLDDTLYVLVEKGIQLKTFVDDPEYQHFPSDIIQTISDRFKAFRDVSIFENQAKEGQHLMSLKENLLTTHDVHTFATDRNISFCKRAKINGVDSVAKKGLRHISHNCFDMTLNFIDKFSFYHHSVQDLSYGVSTDEQKQFKFIFQRSIPKHGSIVLFNLPYYKIPEFSSQILNNLHILGSYRVDDEVGNVLFVCSYRKSELNQKLELKKATLNYQKLPHYTDMPVFLIPKGELTLPKSFRALFVDDDDMLHAFKGKESSIDVAEQYYRPTEKAIELNRPLQAYKEGHLPAVATIEIVNGVYDTNHLDGLMDEEIDFPNIYTTKIVQQDVTEEKEELYRGKMVKVVSQKKKNIIVANALTTNGEIIELLNTK